MSAPTMALEDVRALVSDGSMIGIGGAGLFRKPMGLLRALVDAGARDLTVVSFLGSLDVELLLAAGAVRGLHTAGVSLEAAGLAPRYRAARQQGAPTVIEWSEGSLHAALEAAARGVPSLPCATSPRSAIVERNPHLALAADPFEGREVVHARALEIDVALLHVPAADDDGNLFVDGDAAVDGTLARCARTVIASTASRTDRLPRDAEISRIWVDGLVDLHDGAWPTGSFPFEDGDARVAGRWAKSGGEDLDLLRPEVTP